MTATANLRPFTSESVTEGHPDKLADRVSDAILDAVLEQDPAGRVAVETVATRGLVHVVGELSTSAYVEIPAIVRDEVTAIGYDSQEAGFDGHSCGVSVSLDEQSPDISDSVNTSLEVRLAESADPRDVQGAGDQGIMFGYATNETPDLMPAPIWLSHKLAKQLADVRKAGTPGILPDGKTQVTMLYDGLKPVALDTIVVSTQHSPNLALGELQELVEAQVVAPVLESSGLDLDTGNLKLLVNPSGRFVVGGPAADAGLTGRKIIVDTYGGSARHGGGAFSGKDPSKVDRSGAYAARWAAKNLVAAGLADQLEIQLAYAIGSAHPVSVSVDSKGTGRLPDAELAKLIQQVFDFRPRGIIEDLSLLDPGVVRYRDTAAYGHFGREQFPWEKLNRTADLLAAAGA